MEVNGCRVEDGFGSSDSSSSCRLLLYWMRMLLSTRSYTTLLGFWSCLHSSYSVALTLTGQTVELDGVYYYVPSTSVGSISQRPGGSGWSGAKSGASVSLTPLTIVTANGTAAGQYSSQQLDSAVAHFEATDDVFSSGFLEAVYVQYIGDRPRGRPAPGNSIKGVDHVYSTYVSGGSLIPAGPYFLSASGDVHQAWRLYSDFAGAFTETVIGDSDGFSVLPANIPGQALAVAVPSRLYHTPTPEKPLSGVRLGIKDIYNVKGIRTGNGNRAWYHLYSPAAENAVVVQRLVDAGAIIVGKMKTSQFANGETATADWVDQLAPFNPRGDGYQQPSSSSSGPGAGAGSYDWLDLTVGSDTGGSIRGPSGVQGLFGNRPSHGLVSLDGVMPLAPQLDTAGFLTRKPDIWIEAANALYEGNVTFEHTYPTEILLSDFPETAESESDQILLDFVSKLADFLGATITAYNLTTDWAESHSSSTPSLTDLGSLLYPIIIAKEQARLVRDPFYEDYAAKYDGRRPFINPAPLARWAFGDAFPPSATDEALQNKTIFADWFSSHVLSPPNSTANSTASCTNRFLLYPGSGSSASPDYRNEYIEPPTAPVGMSISRVSPYWGGPDFVLPIGQAKYYSNITLHDEYLPVTVDIMAARKCDGTIFGLVEDLVKVGFLEASEAGRTIVGGGDVLFRRAAAGMSQ
ncbi:amidase signature enzyme [Polychaeton citri CBS 116435]|uniref:Amidase signature enzyme n=1 Tax=Polychaeton citri CBS 116435 TaxID=1314669 RepID=A0A9P4QK59_9PEZI|nr:amidase signature enzyme [Polychaeton citri CBS 116435]